MSLTYLTSMAATDELLPQFAGIKLPSCWSVVTDNEKPGSVWIDFWTVSPTADGDHDYERGIRLGEETLRFAAEVDEPRWVDCTLTWMNNVVRSERKELGPLEHGFLHCVLKKDPGLADRLLTTFYGTYPQLRN
jgi:hypothetical protein